MSRIGTFIALAFAGVFTAVSVTAQENSSMPEIICKDGRYALMVDGKPYMILGGQAKNSSTWPRMLPHLWAVADSMYLNTLEIPVYWEQVEPEQGKFDFSMVQMLLDGARQHNKRLVILWFATWKNGSNHYMPEWMKSDSKRYPNITDSNGYEVDSPSPLCTEAMQNDATAFSCFMSYLKENDTQHTVIMVQVENEPGAWGSVRDYSSTAQKLFQEDVPDILLKKSVLNQLGVKAGSKGSWSEVFGLRADEYFHAYHVASYIEYVAKAGKEVYPLPLYTNAALRNPITNPMATEYESGGPTDNVIAIWKAAAPTLSLLAPDIYLNGDEQCLKVLDLYGREDNPLFVPESSIANARYLYNVIAEGIGFAPFGIDPGHDDSDFERNAPVAAEYAVLAPISDKLAQWSLDGKIKAVIEPSDHSDVTVSLGNWTMIVKFSGSRIPQHQGATGRLMVVQTGDNEFLTIGSNCRVNFETAGKYSGRGWQYLKCTEEIYEKDSFQLIRVLNGDESDWGGPLLGSSPQITRFRLTLR